MNKKIPMRTCVISRQRLAKAELLRIVCTKDNQVIVDVLGKINGHGVYVQKKLDIIDKLEKSKMLDKLFDQNIDKSVYDELREKVS